MENGRPANSKSSSVAITAASNPRPTNPSLRSSQNGKALEPATENTPLLNGNGNSNSSSSLLLSEIEPEGQVRSNSSRDDSRTPICRLILQEAWITMKYALPVFGMNMLEYSLVVVSVLSIGHISTTALAAITIGEMTVNVTGLSIILGFASALDTLLPSAWTSPHPQLVGLWTQRMTVVVLIFLIPIFVLWMNAEFVLLKLKQEPEVAHLAAIYLRWMCLGLPAFAFNCISRRYFQAQGLFDVPARIIIVVAPFNVLFNYLLVWGPPAIRIGFIGAPIATSVSYYIISISYIVYGVLFVPRTAWHPISINGLRNLGLVLKLGLAGVGQTASEWWAWDIVALVASQLGSDVVLASQSVLVVTSSTTWQAPFALGIAASIRIGNLLGEHKARRADAAAKAAVLTGLFLACLMSIILLIVRNNWAYLFNEDPAVVSLVASIIPLLAMFQVFDANAAITSGILRARGKQIMGAVLNISAYYVLGIPFGIFLAFKRTMGLTGLWLGLTVALVICAVVGTVLCVWTPDWEKEVEKVMERLESDKRDLESLSRPSSRVESEDEGEEVE
ncbi:MATE efflux family protein [Dendrothele bispora CBS 962.96]|uniref:MATE efflux family protein n=1 Tax=Dendrothele bispora (strain CBS 962.96) TaxID=1314807 RepID=A0A4S8M5F9_DENBC|nr:MATE efflux family protein [Dendrothele bispora CBS 962.96]